MYSRDTDRRPLRTSQKPVSGQSIDVDSSVATSAFIATNMIDELITFRLSAPEQIKCLKRVSSSAAASNCKQTAKFGDGCRLKRCGFPNEVAIHFNSSVD